MVIHSIAPKSGYETFDNETHYKEKLKEWGLSAARDAKKEFWYKEGTEQHPVTIIGYESYGITGEHNTIIIEFQEGNKCCIHPAYLKEMQQSSFGKENIFTDTENKDRDPAPAEGKQAPAVAAVTDEQKPKKTKVTKPKKEKAVKVDLPAEKVHFTGQVKQLALTYNPFTEENDEVVIFENVNVLQEPPIFLDHAWCSHSKTLKKFELAAGDLLEFDGKIAAKKLPKGKDVPADQLVDVPVQYKINNPSKIVKN